MVEEVVHRLSQGRGIPVRLRVQDESQAVSKNAQLLKVRLMIKVGKRPYK